MKNIFFLCLLASINTFGQMIPIKDFKKSSITIDKVHFDIYKGTIPVKINHSDSSSAILSLPVYVIKSISKSPAEPIYWMEGGPGQSNLKLKPPKALLANHDFVLVGYRGVDGPVNLKSKKVDKAMKGLHNQLLSNESLDNLELRLKQYADDLIKKGIDVNHFTILDVIDDFEEVRKQLGHQKINIYSASYGTRVALLYSYRYPEAIKRSLMVGVNPPGRFIWYPNKTDRVLETYDSIYKTQSKPTDISIQESMRISFERMPKRWSFFKLDVDKIKTTSFLLLFQKSTAIMVFDAYRRAALQEDYSGLYLMQLAYDYVNMFMKFSYGDLYCKAASADYNKDIDYRKLLRPNKNEIGAPYSMLLWGVSSKWPVKLINSEYRIPQHCNTETLMVGGNLDISTPVEFATEELLPYMPNAKQVILKDMAHCGDLMWLQYDAFNYMASRYFDEGQVDTSKFKYDTISFTPKKSLNKMAKVYYPFVLILNIFK